jgi:pyruvate formate lyase activating enzyme
VSVEEVMAEVVKDKTFYAKSGGGTTISGGEPMMQFEFTREFLKQAKEFGLHTCIETSGAGAAAQFAEISRHVDIFLYDIKATDPKLHEQLTGVSRTRIVENVMMLDEMGANIILRCPIVPNLNDGREHFEGIARLGNQLKHIVEIHVLPYNVLGISKSRRLGKDATYDETEMPNDKQTEQWLSAIEESTRVKVRKT